MRPVHKRITRRTFFRQAGGAAAGLGAGLSLPTVITSNALGGPGVAPASERILIGCIGVGNQGGGNMSKHIKNVIAVCEVDKNRLAEAKAKVEKTTGRSCAAYGDYRKLLENKDVDAVVITVPDHWHALITVNACEAGKDVYCEKPLTLTIYEGRVMVKAARKYDRIVQTGSQQRSADNFRLACELVRSGRLGKIHTVRAGISGVNFKGPAVPDSDPPPELDYNFWLGPAPWKPYNVKRVHYNFRFFWDYSGGQMTNWGAHHLDIAQWGLDMDESGPIAAETTAPPRYNKEGWFEVPEWCEVTYKYANGITLICGQDQRGGTTFEGENGTIYVNRSKLESKPADIIKEPLKGSDIHLYVSKDHHQNWLDCIKTRQMPIGDVEIGHRSATVCHLGNIAIRSGKKVTWDPVKEEIVGDAELAKRVHYAYRAPWRLPEL